MANANQAKDTHSALSNQDISLLTASGTMDLYVLSVGNGVSWVLPQSLALEEISLKPASDKDKDVVWKGKKIPLIMLSAKNDVTHALVIEGVQDQLCYAIATTSAPVLSQVRMSALKDVDSVADAKGTSKASQFAYQHIKHDDQIWIVPDLEEIERSFK